MKQYACLIDIRTSGFDIEKHEILEISAKRISFVRSVDWKSSILIEKVISYKVFPRNPDVDPYQAKQIGYHPEIWKKQAIKLPVVLAHLIPMLEDAYIFGVNPSIGLSFLYKEIKSLGWKMPKVANRHPIDLASVFIPLWFKGQINHIQQNDFFDTLQSSEELIQNLYNLILCIE